MPSTRLRSFTKACLWEFGMFFLGVLILWSWYGSLEESIKVNLFITILKAAGLFVYERAWKKVTWGKYQ